MVTPNLSTKLGSGPPTLTPPVRKEEPRARKALDLKAQVPTTAGASDPNATETSGSEEPRVPTTASPHASQQTTGQSPRGQSSLQSPQPLYSPYAMYNSGPPSVQGFPTQA